MRLALPLGWPDAIPFWVIEPSTETYKEEHHGNEVSVRKAIEQARGCLEGDLFLDADARSVFFAIGMRDS